jgi:hypothetical protein
VRSWVLYARFEVRNGKLDRSLTSVQEFRIEGTDSGEWLVPYGYEVETRRDSANFNDKCHSQDYGVYLLDDRPLLKNVLHTCVLQSAGTPTKRGFDVHLRCLNGLFRSCRFDELAPSAWADYSAKDGGTSAPDPHK